MEGRLPEVRIVLYLVGSVSRASWRAWGREWPECILLPPGMELPVVAPPLICPAVTGVVPSSRLWGQAPGSWLVYGRADCEVAALHTLQGEEYT